MFVFGFAVDARGGEAAARRVRAMMEARGGDPDATLVTRAGHAAAGLSRWSVTSRDDRAAPIWDAERQWLVTGDVRLYNRPELLDELRSTLRRPDPPDLELAWLAYARWGREVGRRLVGDFAFVVWDERSRSVFAVRDHLGVRPLHRHDAPEGLVLASDVRQILGLLPSALSLVDEHKVLDRFMRRQRTFGRTFFRGITLVRPGHALEAGPRGTREVRYWYPPEPDERTSYGEHAEAFRTTFERAVRDRLDTERPIVAHSSGGYDSSSILIMAERIYAAGGARPPLVMASALSPGMPSDESHLMDIVGRLVRFEGYRWSALDEPSTAPFDDPSVVRPGMGRGPGGGPRADFELAHARGARVLITGHLGDTLMYAWGLRRDLLRHGRLGPLARETVGTDGLHLGARFLVKASLGVLPPPAALSLADRVFGRPGPMPPWFGPRLREIYTTAPRAIDTLGRAWPSHLACETWAILTSAQVAVGIDAPVQGAASAGLEIRMPYADVRLVEGVLRIPASQRMKRGMRALREDTLGAMMPPELRRRRRQPSWEPTFARAARRALPRVAELLRDGDWLSAPYSDRAEVARWLAQVTRQGENAAPRDCITVADLGVVEAWLRRLLSYDAQPRWRDDRWEEGTGEP